MAALHAPLPIHSPAHVQQTYPSTHCKITPSTDPTNRCNMNHHGLLLIKSTEGQQAHTNADVVFRQVNTIPDNVTALQYLTATKNSKVYIQF